MTPRRVTLFSGHYGSGKTNLALDYALRLKEQFENVALADLDIVNPYFRSKDSEAALAQKGIRLIASPYAGTNVDAPALPAEAYALIDDKRIHAVLDIGGDDRGALALGRYAPAILEEGDYDSFLVVNFFRPLTRTAQEVVTVMNEILVAGKIPYTGIINNSNLGEQTTPELVLSTVEKAEELSRLTGLPVVRTTVMPELFDALKDQIVNLDPITLTVHQSWAYKEE